MLPLIKVRYHRNVTFLGDTITHTLLSCINFWTLDNFLSFYWHTHTQTHTYRQTPIKQYTYNCFTITIGLSSYRETDSERPVCRLQSLTGCWLAATDNSSLGLFAGLEPRQCRLDRGLGLDDYCQGPRPVMGSLALFLDSIPLISLSLSA